MYCQPQVIRQCWFFLRCFPVVCVRWAASPQREIVYKPLCYHSSPVRALINILLPIVSKPYYLRFSIRHPLIRLRFLTTPCLYFCHSDTRDWPYLLIDHSIACCLGLCMTLILWLSTTQLLNKRLRLCLTLVCFWFLEWYLTHQAWITCILLQVLS